jgi:hypothetical protein
MISLSMWRHWAPSRRPSVLWNNPIPRVRISATKTATIACRLFHVFCIVTGPLRSIHSYRSVHRLLKKTRIRRRKLHFPSHDPHYPQQMHADRANIPPRVSFSFTAALLDLSPASVMRFLTVLGQPRKAVLRLAGRN